MGEQLTCPENLNDKGKPCHNQLYNHHGFLIWINAFIYAVGRHNRRELEPITLGGLTPQYVATRSIMTFGRRLSQPGRAESLFLTLNFQKKGGGGGRESLTDDDWTAMHAFLCGVSQSLISASRGSRLS